MPNANEIELYEQIGVDDPETESERQEEIDRVPMGPRNCWNDWKTER